VKTDTLTACTWSSAGILDYNYMGKALEIPQPMGAQEGHITPWMSYVDAFGTRTRWICDREHTKTLILPSLHSWPLPQPLNISVSIASTCSSSPHECVPHKRASHRHAPHERASHGCALHPPISIRLLPACHGLFGAMISRIAIPRMRLLVGRLL
jgi:hypothetical protein